MGSWSGIVVEEMCSTTFMHTEVVASDAAALLSLKGTTRSQLLFFLFEWLGASAVEHLKPGRHSLSHACMHVGLGAFDVVVEVVTEVLGKVDGLEHVLGLQVLLEQNYYNKNQNHQT
jgi:hypothetical protein